MINPNITAAPASLNVHTNIESHDVSEKITANKIIFVFIILTFSSNMHTPRYNSIPCKTSLRFRR